MSQTKKINVFLSNFNIFHINYVLIILKWSYYYFTINSQTNKSFFIYIKPFQNNNKFFYLNHTRLGLISDEKTNLHFNYQTSSHNLSLQKG